MNKFQKIALAIGVMSFIAIAPVANATLFNITGASFAEGSGYGTDADENGGTLLDVQFSTSGFVDQNFSLNLVDDFYTFTFGTVNLLEPNAHSGITANETDNLGVTASFTFTDPLGTIQNVLATGTATTGSVSDSAVDYTLVWTPVQVAFGTGGLFEIAMDSLSFTGASLQNQSATITLRTLPATNGDQTVPEPTTLALLGLGLLGFAASRRKSAGNNSV